MSPLVTPVPGKPNLILGRFDVAELGYVAEEFFVSGTASSFRPAETLQTDGRWTVTRSGTADYTTRMVVLVPAEPAMFNGTVLVEWLNVSGGIDAPAVWLMAHREIVRAGYAYVAVSAQRVGVEGGVSRSGFNMPLKTLDPQRYAPLSHPGDAFSYDIFSQIAALIRDAAHSSTLGSVSPENIVAVGESQSAFFLTTYVNAIDPLAKAYDGFLIHSRFAPAAPLDGSSIFAAGQSGLPPAVAFRPDLRVPLITVITETDLVGGPETGYYRARQPDSERLRIWEIPGAAHADNYTINVAPIDTGHAPLEEIAAAYAPTRTLMGQQLTYTINFAPQHHYVVQAALTRLCEWVRTGTPAPAAPRIALTDTEPVRPVLDSHGLAQGGVRTPWVDVPVARTTGFGANESPMSDLFGSGELFDAATLRRLYPGGAADYLERFTAALDSAIRSGFILSADRAEILRLAAATCPDGL
ncbi:hypothetical protein BMW24_001415 [Mycobacterium heckeshornense]|uniref:Alpha/beta hydrolase domain-containing protein n=1 Tax=Mycobacterium heckeshornense TaxID=110505 RepID=A0A2G8BJB1_9MYCO|nr:hypothetical protein ACT16_17925 [Mycobacterium heckeshornense]PIJ37794.1 hypothetical protein BMW24_001415 [Mycobacterium heckeshornense]BCO37733.1 hypothetical protein MHEC_41660 [Mycobacterium heckeshornense]